MKKLHICIMGLILSFSFFGCGEEQNPVPTLTQISPSEIVAGSDAFTLTLVGTNFINDSKVVFNGIEKTTTYISGTELTAEINATDIPPVHMAEVQNTLISSNNTGESIIKVLVRNPPPGGGDSNSVDFTLNEITWEKTFGGTGEDVAYFGEQTSDGGYIIVGHRDGGYLMASDRNEYRNGDNPKGYFGSTGDYFLIKTDISGNKIWEKSSDDFDNAHSVKETSDGGYIIVGYEVFTAVADRDLFLLKTDSSGNETWHKFYGGDSPDEAYSVQQTSDGGYIIAGYTESYGAGKEDMYLIKTDASGNKIWEKTFGGKYDEGAYSVQQTSDGGYILVGYTEGHIYLVKTNASGDKSWDKEIWWATAYSVQQTSDGGYIIGGRDQHDMYIWKTDALGNISWEKHFGGTYGDGAYFAQQTSDGGYIIAGGTASYGEGSEDMYLVKTDSSGNKTWSKTFGGEDHDKAYSVQQTSDGGYILVGYTTSYGAGYYDMYVVRTDENGQVKKQLEN